jgi:hypothetical protein
MQLEKEKKEKRERERCRALAQRIAEEANPASAALLGEQMPKLTKALHRAGVETEEWTEGSAAELLVVADPAWETLPETLPARVLLAFRLDVNEWKGERKVQFLVEGAQL